MLVLLRVDEPENLQIWQKNIDFGDGWTLKNLGFRISFGYCNTTNDYKVLGINLLYSRQLKLLQKYFNLIE